MFFDRPDSGELAVLVHLEFPQHTDPDDPREFEELVLSAGGDPVDFISGQRSTPHARYFVGTGKLEELKQCVQLHDAELVIFNHNLSPSQERNLEQELKCRVLDRTGLILDIFAQRARTHEGKLQVELAQLRHMSTRLIRGWTHLERQKGGIGLRGPGETQLETDRRLLRGRIKAIEKRLEKVRKQRDQGRRSRRRADVPTVSLVGYTNAGKSTLFNHITQAGVYAQDQLFATLDPTMRRIQLPSIGSAVLADTVGFISHLPHRLVEAFRATLEEAASSDLLLHVIDAPAEERARNIEQVEEVLKEIGAADLPQLRVYNKIDLLDGFAPRVDRDDQGKPLAVWLSAQTGTGVELLFDAITELLGEERVLETLYLEPSQSRLRARLYEHNAVTDEHYTSDGSIELAVSIQKSDLLRILSQEHLSFDALNWRSHSAG
ncbi:GTPase HflX [Aestuariicella hydrocarbonica]|uniref:GTPase HflX n=1 Tax=Pseudomaricurvus hydrocarbonicus TaxID=1470433 RepID=A0A9E5MPJ7_9GAMM|nr:ribosome rescue GTPase HflX [Aestuariicella hydrocarbonica]NHO68124.1 GTPase HflX [Aestuariicella hydrocarbonica]